MFPTINLKETGINIRRIMDKRGIEPKDVQKYLKKQQNDEPINNAFASALAGIKLD